MARDTAAVLAALVAAADDDILDPVRGKPAFGDNLGDDAGEHVVGAHLGERAGMSAKRGAQTGIHVGVEHGAIPPQLRGFALDTAKLSRAGAPTGGSAGCPRPGVSGGVPSA